MLDESVITFWNRMWPTDRYLEERLRCVEEVIALGRGNPIIAVVGSAQDAVDSALSKDVGTVVAQSGVHLLTGGRGGVMRDVTRAFLDCPEQSESGLPKGKAIAVLPQDRKRNGLPGQIVVQTQLPGDDPLGPGLE